MSFDDVAAHLRAGQLPVCHRPIFVIGSPRSGTTALARALGEHHALWTSHESYFLNGLFGDGRAGYVHGRQTKRSGPGWLITEDVDRAEFLAYVGAGLNALFTSRSGGRRWIDQTPLYTLFVDDIAELFPDAQFIHIVRDGRRVVNSMLNFTAKFTDRPEATRHLPHWVDDFGAACRTWADYATHAEGFRFDNPDRSLTVVNETLSAEPAAGFAAIAEFLDESDDPACAAYFSTTRVNSSYVADDGPGEQAWQHWSSEQREVFMAEAGAAMIDLGLADADELVRWAAGEHPAPARR